MKKVIYINIVSYLYALLFLYTGISKFIDQEPFRQALYKSPLPKQIVPQFVIGIPLLELIIAFALLLPFFQPEFQWRKWGLYAGVSLMTLFTLYVGYMLRFQNGHLPCSCGGIIQKMNWRQHFYFNSGFTTLGMLAVWLNNQHLKTQKNKLVFS